MERFSSTLGAWFASGGWVAPSSRLLLAAAIVGVSFLAAKLVGAGLRRLRDRSRVGRPLIYIVEKLAVYGLVIAGFFVGFTTLGVDLTSFAMFAGAVGIGVGLGLQGVVREFVSAWS